MTLDEIKLMWKKDCIVDDIELDKSSLDVPKLHAKYSELLSDTLVKLKQKQFQYNLLIKDKWLWFNGKLDKETIDKYGWKDDPFDGMKVMKADMHYFFNSDDDLAKLKAQEELLKIQMDFLKECMQNITWRHQTIKNTIDWRKFMAGQ
jgi:hypothetical protein